MEDLERGIYVPKLNEDDCDHCGICLKVCPGIGIDFDKVNMATFSKKPENALIGNCIECYAGYASDLKLRYKCSSGGLVTALLSFALEEGLIDGALVTGMKDERPLIPFPFIARTREEVISAVGSKYCPVPAGVVLKEMLKKRGRYAVVGLPCHIQGIRKAEILNRKLRGRILYHFGLTCNHTPSFHATKYLLRKLKISEEKVVKIDYRGEGWPGSMCLMLNNGSKVFVPYFSPYYWGYVFQHFFWPSRCLICDDKLCELADITFMDAWIPEFSSDKIGTSLIIVRSKEGKNLVEKAVKHGVVKLERVPVEKIIEAQSIEKAIRKLTSRKIIMRLIFKKYIKYKKSTIKPTYPDLLEALHFLLTNEICRNNSEFSQLLINYHVAIWNIVRSIKKLIPRTPGKRKFS
jgi:coenzyme F420 hydrogenase subunit beta